MMMSNQAYIQRSLKSLRIRQLGIQRVLHHILCLPSKSTAITACQKRFSRMKVLLLSHNGAMRQYKCLIKSMSHVNQGHHGIGRTANKLASGNSCFCRHHLYAGLQNMCVVTTQVGMTPTQHTRPTPRQFMQRVHISFTPLFMSPLFIPSSLAYLCQKMRTRK